MTFPTKTLDIHYLTNALFNIRKCSFSRLSQSCCTLWNRSHRISSHRITSLHSCAMRLAICQCSSVYALAACLLLLGPLGGLLFCAPVQCSRLPAAIDSASAPAPAHDQQPALVSAASANAVRCYPHSTNILIAVFLVVVQYYFLLLQYYYYKVWFSVKYVLERC